MPKTFIPSLIQWEFQDPKMEVLYHTRPYFGCISPYIALTWAIYVRYLQLKLLKWPLIDRTFAIPMMLGTPIAIYSQQRAGGMTVPDGIRYNFSMWPLAVVHGCVGRMPKG